MKNNNNTIGFSASASWKK